MKRFNKYFKRILAALGIFILCYFLAVFLFPQITFKGVENPDTTYVCFLKSNGSHIDFVLPLRNDLQDWNAFVSQKNIDFEDSVFQYIAFGWGDKNFYLHTPTWDDLTFSTAFNAAFWLSSGAMHVTYYQNVNNNELTKKIVLNAMQYKRLCAFIQSSFVTNDVGQAIVIPTNANYGPRDAFYESNRKYSLFHTCNTWINKGLKASQTKHCLWTALSFGVMDLY